ncbi:beta-glucoside-specific PTS transporter subunit IIABC [Aerococcus urinaeequi]
MDYKYTASEIVNGIGGKENIRYMEHCSTRLRFTLFDDSKANVAELEAIDGVVGVRQNVQTQVIIGNEVNEVYAEVVKLVGKLDGQESENQASTGQVKTKKNMGAIFLDFLVGVFQPLVPAIAGGGVLKSLLLLISMFGWINAEGTTYQLLNFIGDAPLYFLPLLVAMTTAKKLNVNPIVAVSAVGALILPGVTTMIADGTTLFTLDVQNIAYTYQVFPAILTVLLYALMEKTFTKYSPKAIRIFFVPMMSMVITVPIALLFLGPLGYQVGEIISAIIMFLYENLGWVATGILAAILPFMVSTGMHKAMLPYAVSTMTAMGTELLYLPASLAHNISESGACFAVAIRTKDTKKRSTAISAGISALFGITEPALYGVTIQNASVLTSVVIGSLVGGLFVGFMGVRAFALVGPGLASITMFADPENASNLLWAFACLAISFIVAFVAGLFLYKEKSLEENVDQKNSTQSANKATITEDEVDLVSPVEGELIALNQVKDDVFSTGLMGKGIAIKPTKGVLYAPADGKVKMVFKTQHALGFETETGIELLFHIGLETVQLKGEHFEALVREGEQVSVGQPLIQFELAALEEKEYDTVVMMVVQNADNYQIQTIGLNTDVTAEDVVLSIEKER